MHQRNGPTRPDVVIVPTLGSGSLDAYAEHLARQLALPVLRAPRSSGRFNHRLLSRRSARFACEDAGAVRALRRVPGALLHLPNHHLARFGPFLGRPYIVTVHDLMRYRDWRERRRRAPFIHRPNVRDGIQLELEAAGIRRAEALIAVSHHTKRELVEQLDIDADRIDVVHEGVDLDRFRPVKRRMIAEPYVLCVGSEQPRKNLGTLLRAFVSVREALPGFKLVKVGSPGGPEAPFRERTLELIASLGLERDVALPGRVPDDDLVAYYSGALCLVLPSRHEGFGVPPLEAMACGCPVVVADAGALPEVAGGAAAVYGAPDDAAALEATLRRVVTSHRLRSELRERGLRRARAFSWESTADRTVAVYRAVLARLGGAAAPDAGAPDAAEALESPSSA